jgi:hypothetical protein
MSFEQRLDRRDTDPALLFDTALPSCELDVEPGSTGRRSGDGTDEHERPVGVGVGIRAGYDDDGPPRIMHYAFFFR